MIRTLGTEFVHFYLLEQDGGVTLTDAGLSGYRDTLDVHRADSERTRQGKTKRTDGSPPAMLTMLGHAHSRRALRHMIANGAAKQTKVPEVIAFDHGDELELPGRLRAIHTPGHTEGHCILHAPVEDALFVGDAVNNIHIVTGAPGAQVAPRAANTSTDQAYESLSRIEEAEARTLYFGHGDPSTQGTRAIVAEARAKR
ncbi:MAG TPA: MBL fold metallo-hydrolase [Solirubrobacteraceae bacterium]|nr:MBL fold metallo-hydrolase [Solirubrobacteraceae bacterium]